MNNCALGKNTTLSKRLMSDLTELSCLSDSPLIQTNKLSWKDHCKHDRTFLKFNQWYRTVFLMKKKYCIINTKKYHKFPYNIYNINIITSTSFLSIICCVMSSYCNISGVERKRSPQPQGVNHPSGESQNHSQSSKLWRQ